MHPRALSRFFARSFALSISLTAIGAFVPDAARAQGSVSDGDRAAARELYVEGVKLQEQGKFDAALERFQRAQSVFSAPTHLLHIAECQAALGRLVESAETYRTLVRTPLPAGSPNAFVQAQQQGNAELTQVEPRIPGIKIQVKPDNVQNMNVQIDGQPMSAALVGVSRPANPGEHTVAVFAPGYGKTEQKVNLKEKEQKEVVLVLQPTSGVVYGPALTPLPAQTPPSNATYATQPNQQLPPPDAPPVYQPPQERHRGPTTSFLIGPRVGLSIPGGNTEASSTATGDTSISQFAGVGGSFGVEGGLRFARVFYIGLNFDHGIYSRGPAIDAAAAKAAQGVSVTSTNTSNYIGFNFAWISNPEGIGFYGELGLGYRWLTATLRAEADSDSSTFHENSATLGGGEGTLGIGVHMRLSDSLRLIPKATISAGSFAKGSGSCSSGGAAVPCAATETFTNDINNTDTHTFIFIGVTGFFDIGKHGTPAATPAPAAAGL